MIDLDGRAAQRSQGRTARRNLVGEARRDAEGLLIQHLMSLLLLQRAATSPGDSVGSVGLFMAHDGEPDLGPLVAWLRGRGIDVALPVVSDVGGDFSMWFVPWPDGTALSEGRYGIAVPPEGAPIDPTVTIVSCVGFDANGNRIGRGAGYFDRYLEERDTAIVGVAFERQRFESIAAAPHDVAMSIMVTDLGVRFIDRPRTGRAKI